MNEQGAASLRRLRQHTNGLGIYEVSQSRLCFCPVDGGICSGVDDNIWSMSLDETT